MGGCVNSQQSVTELCHSMRQSVQSVLRVLLLLLLLLLHNNSPPFAHTTNVFVCVLISTYGYLWILLGYVSQKILKRIPPPKNEGVGIWLGPKSPTSAAECSSPPQELKKVTCRAAIFLVVLKRKTANTH